MLRVALSTYLSLAVVFGPALCCCTMDSFFSSGTASVCGHEGGCNSHGRPAARGHSHAGHSHKADSHSTSTPKSEHDPTPCDHGPDGCPCEQHRETMAAGEPSHDAGQRSLGLLSDFFSTLSFAVLTSASLELDVASTLRLGDIRPCGVYGREILRAYHKLQC
jgi:hypothetical protein